MKEMIKRKKATYGSNFEEIALKWSELLGIGIEAEDVAEMMAHMKECRIQVIKTKLGGADMLSTSSAEKLKSALEDSQKDKAAYDWIANNYEEYLTL